MRTTLKNTVLALSLFVSTAASATEAQDAAAAVQSFNRQPEVVRELTRLSARKTARAFAIEIFKMGDGCDTMTSYLVVQPITSGDYFERTISARVEVTSYDAKECGETAGPNRHVKFDKLVNLHAAASK